MIKSFNCKETEKLFHRETTKKWPSRIKKLGRRKLLIIDAATQLVDLKVPPGNELEKLKGNRKGQHSIRINKQWRICFKWKNGDAYNVEIIDYHH
jgi:proteic killer suppression protein